MRFYPNYLYDEFNFSGVGAVQITDLNVPREVLAGDEVRLRCNYNSEDGSALYSLKWYKDNKEFYRYVPSNPDSKTNKCATRTHTMFGLNIDVSIAKYLFFIVFISR